MSHVVTSKEIRKAYECGVLTGKPILEHMLWTSETVFLYTPIGTNRDRNQRQAGKASERGLMPGCHGTCGQTADRLSCDVNCQI